VVRRATTPRKALVVLGDGTDTNPGRTAELRGLAQQLERERVEEVTLGKSQFRFKTTL